VRYSAESLAAGVQEHKVEGTIIRVTSVAKTVADCFKFRNKVGLDVALEALRDARRSKKVSADEIWRYASVNRVANVMRPYLEAVALTLARPRRSRRGCWRSRRRAARISISR